MLFEREPPIYSSLCHLSSVSRNKIHQLFWTKFYPYVKVALLIKMHQFSPKVNIKRSLIISKPVFLCNTPKQSPKVLKHWNVLRWIPRTTSLVNIKDQVPLRYVRTSTPENKVYTAACDTVSYSWFLSPAPRQHTWRFYQANTYQKTRKLGAKHPQLPGN